MDDAVVEVGAMLAAGSLLTKGKRIPAGQLWSGTPAKFVRDLTEAEKANMAIPAAHYAELGQVYLAAQHGRADLPSLTAAAEPVCRPAEPPAPRMTARIAAVPTGRLPANSRRTRSAAARPQRGRSARHTQQRLRATG